MISAGTEGSTVKAARQGLIGKAKARPQQVKQVLDVLRTQGPIQTYRAVRTKLDAYSPLGYSLAGEVIDVGSEVTDFAVGDRVACAGNEASHAEIVAVGTNLCVRLHPDADLRAASYNALGAIALQGIRRADLQLGAACVVIGLGLIGQLTCTLLRAAGITVFGVDLDPAAVELARLHSADEAWTRDTPGLTELILQQTSDAGPDAVIITAGTTSLDPVNFAGEVCRPGGRVVVVGAVPTGFDRDPHYYRKELQLLMSCSYGPGRYDPEYEEHGRDYPIGQVRWTERRNMQAFQKLVQTGRIDLDLLTTHVMPFERASEAYDMIVNHSEPFVGVLLQYDTSRAHDHRPLQTNDSQPTANITIGFVGGRQLCAKQSTSAPPPQRHANVLSYGNHTYGNHVETRCGTIRIRAMFLTCGGRIGK